MIELIHTSAAAPAALGAAYRLLELVFEGDFGAEDWEHSLGGMHALAWEGDTLVAHGSVVQRRLLHNGRALRCGYVEGVGVHPDHRRRGYGAAVMAALEGVIRGAYDLGALGTTDEGEPLYRARGWLPWTGRLSALTPTGLTPTPEEEGAVYVFPGVLPLDLTAPLTCDWRDGDVW
ncbi:GNAT family N-acetyltransferase [Asanoa siamensis]|uniref:Aminoglycoside N-acetyltransferase AAC(2')-Ie n=1 Tax=Asanoa siamensis TaxID=926357 RepID=A0ABQ4CYK6_9ACTN|nr:GNAT family N-acetyltransferase [Asanoa siamensis]GIF76362.1 aminoglycoside N-acetyltransferase AAC(2')-Ie [Asanoa siamensis]